MAPKPPSDLDPVARKKWKEMIETVDPTIDEELVANYARLHSSLMAIRSEKTRLVKTGKYETLVPGRDGALQLNPLQTAENRMVSSLNRMLRTLGLAPTREEQGRRRPVPDADEIDPLEAALCWPYGRKKIEIWREIRRGKVEPTNPAGLAELKADRVEADRRLESWKVSAGIDDDGADGPIKAPGLDADQEEWSAYNSAKLEQSAKVEAALRRAGLDPRKQ
jgi:phage terminase small subunit